MNYYSYLVEHDYGLAPNPFGQYCTLAVCKPKIRRSNNLRVGDWVIGTGSRALENISRKPLRFRLIYAMQISEIIEIDDYWRDDRFQYKKPIINGPLVNIYGDNIYHRGSDGSWIQENSAHSNADGSTNEKHLQTDVGGKNVLISELFYYFGDNAPLLPKHFHGLCHVGIGEKKLKDKEGDSFTKWLSSKYKPGIKGDPINWIEHVQSKMFIT